MQSLQTLFAWGDWVWKRSQEEVEFPIGETSPMHDSVDECTEESISESIGETALPCEYVHLLFELQGKYKKKLYGVFSSETTAQLAKAKVARSGVPDDTLYLCVGELDKLVDEELEKF